jgi:uncharacterized protein (DUF4415 family)
MSRRRHTAKGDLDSPELTDEFFRRTRPAIELVPHIVKDWQEGRMRMPDGTPVGKPYMRVPVELSADVVDAYKEAGPGWEQRTNATLRRAVRVRRSVALKRSGAVKRKAAGKKRK